MNFLQTTQDLAYDFTKSKFSDAYDKQVQALRQALVGNQVNYSGRSITDEETKKFYNKLTVYTTALQLFTVATQSIRNKSNKTQYDKLQKVSENNQQKEKKTQEKNDKLIKGYYEDDVVNKRKFLESIKNSDRTLTAKAYGKPDEINPTQSYTTNEELEKQNDKFWKENRNLEISQELESSGFKSDETTFPKLGKPIETQNTENGTRFINRASYEVSTNGQKETIFKGWSKFGKPDPDKYSTPSNPMSQKVANMLEEYRKITPGSYKFFIEKLHGKNAKGNFNSKNPIKSGLSRYDMTNRMIFPAYIMAFNDQYNPKWSEYSFIGRGEEVFIYQKTSRELTLEFYMISDFSVELLLQAIQETRGNSNPIVKGVGGDKLKPQNLNNTSFTTNKNLNNTDNKTLTPEQILAEIRRLMPDWGAGSYPESSIIDNNLAGFVPGAMSGTPEMMWARLTFLAQCCYPWYRKDGKLKEQPFIRIRIGDFIDCIAKINSLNCNEYDGFDVDLNPSSVGAIPMGVRIVMSMTIIHEEEPTSNYSRFYWRKDFDTEALNYIPANISETSETLDSALDSNKNSSALHSIDPASNFGQSNLDFPKSEIANQESLKTFQKDINILNNSAGSLNDSKKPSLIRSALLSAKKFLEIKRISEASKLKNVNEEENVKKQEPSNKKKLFS